GGGSRGSGGSGGGNPTSSCPGDASAPAHPFGSHQYPYAQSTLKPGGAQDALDTAVKNYYMNTWKAKYVKQGCGPNRYFIEADADPTNKADIVSEGQGYGMVVMALMAGADPEARTIFDGMYHYMREHASTNTPDLM